MARRFQEELRETVDHGRRYVSLEKPKNHVEKVPVQEQYLKE